MTYLLTGLIFFFGIHAVPMFPDFKGSLQARFGATRFKGIYSLFALSGFALILFGTSSAEFRPIYTPPAWSAIVAGLAMPVAFCLFVAAFMPNNFYRVIRHPMLSGVIVWSLAHLLANGDLASVLLFGSFGTFAVVDIISVNRRSAAEPKAKQPLFRDILVLVVGFTAFLVVRYFHAALFGVPVVR